VLWLLTGKVKTSFDEDYTVFVTDDFFDRIHDFALAKFMAECTVELYNNKISHMCDTKAPSVPGVPDESFSNAQDAPIKKARPKESYAIDQIPAAQCFPDVANVATEETVIEEAPIEGAPIEGAPIEGAPIEEAQPKECCSIKETYFEQPHIQETSIDGLVTAKAPVDFSFGTPAEDEWGIFSSAVKDKKKKKKEKGEKEMTAVEEPEINELPTPACQLAPPPEDEWGSFSFGSAMKKKKSKKGKKQVPEVEEPSEPVAETKQDEFPSKEAGNWDFSPSWIDGTIVSNSRSDSKAKSGQPIEAEGEICHIRAKHLLGDEWKDCRQCRIIVRQVATQLAREGHANEDGFAVVDQILME
jgi:hypothetical protein